MVKICRTTDPVGELLSFVTKTSTMDPSRKEEIATMLLPLMNARRNLTLVVLATLWSLNLIQFVAGIVLFL